MKKIISFFGFLGIVFVLSGCSWFDSEEELSPELVLPVDSKFVVVLDKSNEEQMAIFEELMTRFPAEEEGVKSLIETMKLSLDYQIKSALPSDIAMEDFKEIWEGKVKIAFGMEGIVSAKLSNGKKLEQLLAEDGFEEDKSGEIKYWKKAKDDIYIGNYDDLYWYSDDVNDLAEVEKRIEERSGFSSEIASDRASNYLAYFYVEPGAEEFADYQEFENLIKAYDYNISVLSAESDGLRLKSKSKIADKEFLEDFYEGEASFKDEVPGRGMISYYEGSGFGKLLEMFDVAALLSEISGEELVSSDLENYFEGPFAFALGEAEGFVPSLVLFAKVDKSAASEAENFHGMLDNLVDKFIKGFNEEMVAGGGGEVLSKEILAVKGEALKKVKVDWAGLPTTTSLQYNALFGNLNDVVLEFYYGMLDENTFVIGFYPDLLDKYGKDVFSASDEYKQAFSQIAGGKDKHAFSYMNFEPLSVLIERYLAIEASDMFPEDSVKMVRAALKLLNTIEFTVQGSSFEGDYEYQESFIKIGRKGKLER